MKTASRNKSSGDAVPMRSSALRATADEGGVTARLIRSWLARRKSRGDIDAWMDANDNRHGRNACAIEKNVRYVYFKKGIRKKGIRGIYIKKNVKKENW